ncbi:ferredoxin-dependent glutamate synthase [Anopheles sinensis]|uniref:Ferredoxin-dependent glutamate synthase n=1 Tax=Anopheles sinensis TaxID=74873 RepID=A0A084VH09_ANOSI|nr:ferredoxin-dependent glutamate synthase [Anopheles sinensis]
MSFSDAAPEEPEQPVVPLEYAGYRLMGVKLPVGVATVFDLFFSLFRVPYAALRGELAEEPPVLDRWLMAGPTNNRDNHLLDVPSIPEDTEPEQQPKRRPLSVISGVLKKIRYDCWWLWLILLLLIVSLVALFYQQLMIPARNSFEPQTSFSEKQKLKLKKNFCVESLKQVCMLLQPLCKIYETCAAIDESL